MSVLSTAAKSTTAVKTAKGAVKRPALMRAGARATPPVGKLALKAGAPLLKRRTRRRARRLGQTARAIGETLVVYGPPAAYELGLAEPPKPKRTAPRVAAGIVIGASAVYFLEPEHGREHREKVTQLVS